MNKLTLTAKKNENPINNSSPEIINEEIFVFYVNDVECDLLVKLEKYRLNTK